MRSVVLFLVPVMLAACDGTTPIAAPTGASGAAQPVVGKPSDTVERVACSLGRAAPFTMSCIVERLQDNAGLALIIRHPDGGFRRFRVATDGRGVIAADGAEPAIVRVIGKNEVEVATGDDRYRLPATVRGLGTRR